MTHGSLFSGIGGFDLAARNCGLTNIFQVEIDNFCRKVLEKNFPETVKYGDINDFDGTKYTNAIDIVSGGFPCQPFSIAGKREGTSDDRYLWEEMFRVVTEVKPKWVIVENVPGLLTIEEGLVFEKCLLDLESAGYEAQTFIIPAIAQNAPHRRDRIWIIANAESSRYGRRGVDANCFDGKQAFRSDECHDRDEVRSEALTSDCDIANADSNRDKRFGQQFGESCEMGQRRTCDEADSNDFNQLEGSNADIANSDIKRERELRDKSKTQGTSESDGLFIEQFRLQWYEVATELCRMDDGLPNRVDRIKALGNAIVPQIAEIIFKTIIEVENG